MSGSNLFVVTGGPGSGKSTLIAALREEGFAVAEEAGRSVIREEVASGGNALPWGDRLLFADKMLEQDVASFERFAPAKEPVFFNRGIPDVLGYLVLCGLPVPLRMEAAARRYGYNRQVFIAPHWPDIYRQDEERKQDEGEAARTCEAMRTVYTAYGYELIDLPRLDVAGRVRFVLGALGLSL